MGWLVVVSVDALVGELLGRDLASLDAWSHAWFFLGWLLLGLLLGSLFRCSFGRVGGLVVG